MIEKSDSFIKKAVKFTAIGIVVGLAISLLFPPLGVAIMAISAIAGVAAIGAKVAHSYTNTKEENSYNKESTENKTKILRDIVRELMGKKLSKEEIKQHEEKNDIRDDSKQNIKTFTGVTRKKVEDTIGNVIKKGMINDQKLPFDSMLAQ